MSRRNDLPQQLCVVHERYSTPYISVWAVGIAMILLVLFFDLSNVVAVSTFALLFWYVFANIAAFKLKVEKRLFPRVVPILGLATCLALLAIVFAVAQTAWIVGVAFLATGTAIYAIRKRLAKTTGDTTQCGS